MELSCETFEKLNQFVEEKELPPIEACGVVENNACKECDWDL